jgi:hypothetical protein
MSEIKFSCGHCSQHITAEAAWAGQQIKCPNCQGDLVIPQPLVANAPKPVSVAAPPPVPPPLASPAAPRTPAAPRSEVPVKLWLLALAPLPLAFIGFFTMGVGIMAAKSMYGALAGLIFLIPSVLCAHAAVNEKSSNRALSGSQAAGIAAVVAYFGMVVAYILILLILYRTVQVTYYKMTGKIPASQRSSPFLSGRNYEPPTFNTTPAASSTPRTSTAPAKPPEPPVTTDPNSVTIPDAVPSGTLLDAPFTCTGVQYDAFMSTLEINQGGTVGRQAGVKMFLFLKNRSLAGQSVIIGPADTNGGASAHVYLTGSDGKSEVLSYGYALRLEFSQPDKGVITGRIYLETQKSIGTKISGTFKFPGK